MIRGFHPFGNVLGNLMGFCKIDSDLFRIEFSRSENPKINQIFLVRTTSSDDVITTDETSKTSTAVWWHDIKKREWDSLNSFLQAFQKYIFRLPVQIFFHFRSDQMAVTSGKFGLQFKYFRNQLSMSQS